MLKNKHLIAALIIAPILAVVAWFAVDYTVSERPEPAQKGAHYPLTEMPNCRYQSGLCSLKNGDVKVTMALQPGEDGLVNASLVSSLPMAGGKLALVDDPAQTGQPVTLDRSNEQGTRWTARLAIPTTESSRIQLALSIDDALYYGDVATTFVEYQTSFDKDFRRSESPQ